jgi:hypothetical protein
MLRHGGGNVKWTKVGRDKIQSKETYDCKVNFER